MTAGVTGYKLGADVMVDLTDEKDEHGEVLHYGTVHKTRNGARGAVLYRVSGLPRRWLEPWRLNAAVRPPVEP
jgi:hypothetical protein